MKSGECRSIDGINLGYHYKAKAHFTALKDSCGGVAASGKTARLTVGKCIYIHPAGRFVTLEFPVRHGTIRECFQPGEIQ